MKLKLCSLFIALFFVSCNINKNEKLVMLQGYISWQQKDWNQAIFHFLDAKEIAETKSSKIDYATYALASTYLMQNEFSPAMNNLIKLENTTDNELSASVFYQLGLIAFKRQQYKLAASYFKKSLEKEPDRMDAKINYELSIKSLDDELIQNAKNAKINTKEDNDTYDAVIDIFKKQEKEEWNEKKETGIQENTYDY